MSELQSAESPCTQQNNSATDAPVANSAAISTSNNDSKKVSHKDIVLVQNLIERCLQLYMSRDEVVKTLLNRAKIEPGFTTLVWQKLEEENADFFRAYYIRLKLKKQIIMFNHLLERQYHLMKYPVQAKVPLAPIQNGIPSMAGNGLPMGYPILQQPSIPPTGQPHLDSMGCGPSSCHLVNGVPVASNYHPIPVNSENEMMMKGNEANVTPPFSPSSVMPSTSEMAMSPNSVASSGHFPFATSEMTGMGVVDASVLDDTTYSAGVTNHLVGLQLAKNGDSGIEKDSFELGQIPWNFSLSDLTADFSHMGELGSLGDYPGSPFLHSDSDVLLDSSENDNMVDEFFVDPSEPIPGSSSHSAEEKEEEKS
ncbi:hypothetical protein Sjap_021115 [Stephania japonica]|uniref:Angiotensin-converting enzyme 2 n=1 Tax=Stephania japonica TaxID=461633 RepID=A0AAP0I0U2_9MAGN